MLVVLVVVVVVGLLMRNLFYRGEAWEENKRLIQKDMDR